MTDAAQLAQITIAPLVVPNSLDAPDAGPFRTFVRLANEMARHDTGHDYLDQDAQEALGFWQDERDWTHVGFTAHRLGEMVGVGTIMVFTESTGTIADFEIVMDPNHRGQGTEEALLVEIEREARERGRQELQTWTLHRPDAPGQTLIPSTGWGAVPADDPQTVFPAEHGFTLEQVERNSVFDLTGPLDAVAEAFTTGIEFAGADYRLVTWTGPTPPRYLDSFAYALSRMSTDTPACGLTVDEEEWDAARVIRRDERLSAQGLTGSVACIEHVPSAAIVAFSQLVIGEDRTGAAQQWGTLVIKEHRGHRLGTVVKCANILRWHELVPECPRISTFNAEENRHMLDINEAMGFAAVSFAGAWKKVLS